jgi:hypothetical protein
MAKASEAKVLSNICNIGRSNLDIDLDSVIKKQKEKEFEKEYEQEAPDWYGQPSRKRNHHPSKYDSSKPEVEEVNIEEKEAGSAGVISLSTRNNNIRNNKRQKVAEEAEIEGEGEGDAVHEYHGGYKGKKANFFDPYMASMGGMQGYGGYPQMYMDPYMMYGGGGAGGGYGYGKPPKAKKFKNKSLIVKKDGKTQDATSTTVAIDK